MTERWTQTEMDWQAGEAYAEQVRARSGARAWTIEEARACDGLYFGCEQELAYWDAVHKQAITYCEVCERMFHQDDLEPCGPAEAACSDCCEAWTLMENAESEGTDVSQ